MMMVMMMIYPGVAMSVVLYLTVSFRLVIAVCEVTLNCLYVTAHLV